MDIYNPNSYPFCTHNYAIKTGSYNSNEHFNTVFVEMLTKLVLFDNKGHPSVDAKIFS